jgi:hypothetical protein
MGKKEVYDGGEEWIGTEAQYQEAQYQAEIRAAGDP